MKHRGETNFYLCEINRDMVIDATYKGNKSRYINHSCCPNTEMQKWFFTHPYAVLLLIVLGLVTSLIPEVFRNPKLVSEVFFFGSKIVFVE